MVTELSKSTIMHLLQNGVVNVKFTKSDGTERDMKCTLMEAYITGYTKKTERVKVSNPEIYNVWDVENEGWRSFKHDSIISVHK